MKFTMPMLLGLGIGTLLLWCGITDRNPVQVLKAIFTGQSIPVAGSGSTFSKVADNIPGPIKTT